MVTVNQKETIKMQTEQRGENEYTLPPDANPAVTFVNRHAATVMEEEIQKNEQ